jgi:hypothetical protein
MRVQPPVAIGWKNTPPEIISVLITSKHGRRCSVKDDLVFPWEQCDFRHSCNLNPLYPTACNCSRSPNSVVVVDDDVP